jgi:hypothetical protein
MLLLAKFTLLFIWLAIAHGFTELQASQGSFSLDGIVASTQASFLAASSYFGNQIQNTTPIVLFIVS